MLNVTPPMAIRTPSINVAHSTDSGRFLKPHLSQYNQSSSVIILTNRSSQAADDQQDGITLQSSTGGTNPYKFKTPMRASYAGGDVLKSALRNP